MSTTVENLVRRHLKLAFEQGMRFHSDSSILRYLNMEAGISSDKVLSEGEKFVQIWKEMESQQRSPSPSQSSNAGSPGLDERRRGDDCGKKRVSQLPRYGTEVNSSSFESLPWLTWRLLARHDFYFSAQDWQ
jgi:hypothetical protein